MGDVSSSVSGQSHCMFPDLLDGMGTLQVGRPPGRGHEGLRYCWQCKWNKGKVREIVKTALQKPSNSLDGMIKADTVLRLCTLVDESGIQVPFGWNWWRRENDIDEFKPTVLNLQLW